MDDLVTWLRAQIDADDAWFDGVFGYGTLIPISLLDRWEREVTAKRALLDQIERDLADDPTDETAQWMAQVLAAVFADRDGYRTEWAPNPSG